MASVAVTGFWIDIHEVTQDGYTTVRGVANPSGFTTGVTSGEVQGKRPVENVSWYEAIVYCNKSWNRVTVDLNANGYRLPTEAQWEYACRANTNPNSIPNNLYSNQVGFYTYSSNYFYNWFLDRNYAWYSNSYNDKNNSNTPLAQTNSGATAYANNMTHEVGKKLKNAFGLYDMHGNVAEWVWDFSPEYILPYNNAAYTAAYEDKNVDYKNVNPDGLKYTQKPSSSTTDTTGYNYHIPRGGAWSSMSLSLTYNSGGDAAWVQRQYQPLRSAARGLTTNDTNNCAAAVRALTPYSKQNTVGFRVIRPLMTEITGQPSVPRVVYVESWRNSAKSARRRKRGQS